MNEQKIVEDLDAVKELMSKLLQEMIVIKGLLLCPPLNIREVGGFCRVFEDKLKTMDREGAEEGEIEEVEVILSSVRKYYNILETAFVMQIVDGLKAEKEANTQDV